ncbi:MAG TPA: hypothetical protein VGG77_05395 [Roseiarcus sp.]|jgi:hypothetical protein
MRRLPTIAALTLILDCLGAAPVAAAPVCFPCGPSAAITVRREGVVALAGGGWGEAAAERIAGQVAGAAAVVAGAAAVVWAAL